MKDFKNQTLDYVKVSQFIYESNTIVLMIVHEQKHIDHLIEDHSELSAYNADMTNNFFICMYNVENFFAC